MALILSGTDGVSGVDGTASNPAYEGTDSNTGLFYPAADTVGIATGGAEALRVNSSQNVGIGTSSNLTKLTVQDANGIPIRFGDISAAPVSQTAVYVGVSTSAFSGANGDLVLITRTSDSRSILFYTGNGTAAERARITSGGDFLVGTTSADSGAKMRVSYGASQNGIAIQDTNNTNGTSFVIFQNSTPANIGSITRNGTTNAVLYNTTSDYRLKEQVTPLNGGIERVLSLKPVKWVWKDCDGATGEGFIAHELQEVVPSAVNGEKDAVNEDGSIKPQGMDASYLVATLTAAIQEQQALITQLQADVAALKGTA